MIFLPGFATGTHDRPVELWMGFWHLFTKKLHFLCIYFSWNLAQYFQREGETGTGKKEVEKDREEIGI